MMATAIWNWRKWIGLFSAVAFLLLSGCKDSEYSKRKEVSEVVQYLGPKSQPHSAALRWQKIDSRLMQSVCSKLSLRELTILTSTLDESPIFSHVAKLPNLETLNITEVPLNDEELRALSDATRLTSLELSRTGISGCGLRYLTELPIKRLVIRDASLSIDGLQAIACMAELEELELCIPGIRLADMPAMASRMKLKSVRITDGHFSYREHGGLKFLEGADNLTDLHLSGGNLNDRSLKLIGTLSGLRNLTIEECVVSEEGIEHLSSLENLQKMDLVQWPSLRPVVRLAEGNDEVPLPRPIRS